MSDMMENMNNGGGSNPTQNMPMNGQNQTSPTPPPMSNPRETYGAVSHPAAKSSLRSVQEKVEQLLLFFYFAIASILLFRFVLSLFGASLSSGFVAFVYDLTTPFMIPFIGMFGRQPGIGQYRLEFEVLVALVVYALVFFGLSKLINIVFK